MVNLALWLKSNDFRADQVQAFYPSPMATATAMYHSGKKALVPATQPDEDKRHQSPRRKNSQAAHDKRVRRGKVLSQHTGLPPRADSWRTAGCG